MNCVFCGTENPEDAAFCKNCGKPLNGMYVCPSCGQQSPADGAFCIHCGARLHAAPAAQPEQEVPAQQCLQEVPAQQPEPAATQTAAASASAPAAQPEGLWKRALTYLSGAATLISALAAVIFVFCMGVTVNGNLGDVIGAMGLSIPESDIYYYFGDAYKDIETTLTALQSYSGFAETSLYLPVIFGTVIAACSIVAVPVLFIVTLVRYLRNISGATEKTAVRPAVWTFAVFVICAVLFQAVNAIRFDALSSITSGTSMRISAGTALNGATTAGIAVGAVGIAIAVICSAVCRGKQNACVSAILRYAFAAVGVVLFSVMFSLMAGGLAQINVKSSGQDMTVSSGFLQALGMAGGIDLSAEGGLVDQYSDECWQILTYSVVGYIVLIALAVFAAIAFAEMIGGVHEGTMRRGRIITFAALSLVCAVLVTVFAFLLSQQFLTLLGGSSSSVSGQSVTAGAANAIALTVLSAVALIALIVYAVLPAAKEKKEA